MELDGIRTTAAMLTYYQHLEQIAANNLANVATDGFKVTRVIGEARDGFLTPVPIAQLDLTQGTIRETGRMLDIAIDGPGFFVVQVNGEELLTRAGSFTANAGGFLVDLNGAPVLGQGGLIAINGGRLEIREDGTVLVNGQEVDQLRVEDVDDPASLSSVGSNRYRAANGTIPSDMTTTSVRQFSIEESNQNAVQGMVELVEIQRAFMSNMRVMKALDEIMGTIVNSVGSTR